MKILHPSAALLTALALLGCGDSAGTSASTGSGGSGGSGGGEAQGGGPSAAPEFDLSGALAYALGGDDDPRLFKITASGVEVAVDDEVSSFMPLRDGGVAIAIIGNGQFALRPDGSSEELGSEAVGEASNGDIYGRDEVFRGFTGEREELESPLGQLSVMYLSRDVARIDVTDEGGSSLAQVLDTPSGELHTIDGCNNGSMVALSDAVVLLDDCGELPLLDLATGERRAGGTGSLNGEQIAVSDGAVILSQSCPVDGGGYGLCHVDGTGAVSNLSDITMDPPSMACCGDRNRALASDGENSVVALTEGALAFRRSVGRTGVPVADGQTILQLSMGANGVAYYVGGDGLDPVLGSIDVLGGSTTTLDSTRRYAEVRAVPVGP